jgi:hypothetical protein
MIKILGVGEKIVNKIHHKKRTLHFVGYLYIVDLINKRNISNQSHYTPEVPRGFQEVKVPRIRDNGTGWW